MELPAGGIIPSIIHLVNQSHWSYKMWKQPQKKWIAWKFPPKKWVVYQLNTWNVKSWNMARNGTNCWSSFLTSISNLSPSSLTCTERCPFLRDSISYIYIHICTYVKHLQQQTDFNPFWLSNVRASTRMLLSFKVRAKSWHLEAIPDRQLSIESWLFVLKWLVSSLCSNLYVIPTTLCGTEA